MYEVFNMICPYELFNHLSACLYYRNVCQDTSLHFGITDLSVWSNSLVNSNETFL